MIKYKCLSCNKHDSHKLDEDLKKKFRNSFNFSYDHISKSILFLREPIYPYEHTYAWEKVNEVPLFQKEYLCSNLNMEDVTEANYMHAKRLCKDFEVKNWAE